MPHVVDGALPLCRQRRQHQRHAGPHIGRRERRPGELRRPAHHHPVRIAEDDPGTHAYQRVGEEHAAVEHLLEEEHHAARLRGNGDGDRHHVGREGGPGAVIDLGDLVPKVVADCQLLLCGHMEVAVGKPILHAEPAEDVADHPHIVGHHIFDGDGRSGHRRQPDEGADLEVVGADAVTARLELTHPFDGQGVGADAGDLGAERDQHAAEPLHMGLTGGVADDAPARGEHRRHQDVLGARDRRLVEEDVGAREAGRRDADHRIELHRCAQRREAAEVGIEPPTADDITAWRGERGGAETGEQRAGQQDRSAELAAKIGWRLAVGDAAVVDLDGVRPEPLVAAPHALHDLEHDEHIFNARDIVERHGLIGDERGRKYGQHLVLRASGPYRASKRMAPLNDELLHLRTLHGGQRHPLPPPRGPCQPPPFSHLK